MAGWIIYASKLYVTVKAPAGEETDLADIKRRVIAWNPDGLNDDNVELIPVSYSFEDLWSSFIVLNRFAESSGNTIGIQSANIDHNWETYHGESVFPSPSRSPYCWTWDHRRCQNLTYDPPLPIEAQCQFGAL